MFSVILSCYAQRALAINGSCVSIPGISSCGPSNTGGSNYSAPIYTGPSPEEIATQHRHQQAHDLNEQAIQYGKNGQFQAAVDALKEAKALWPEDQTIQNNFQAASSALAQEQAQKEHDQQMANSAQNMRDQLLQSASRIWQAESGSASGLNFDGSNQASGNRSRQDVSSGGLDFMPPGEAAFVGDSSVVDLRFLDSNKPIIIDPNIAKGRERTFPVQLDPETYKNANHNKGLEALQNNDPDLAVRYFEAARKERPNDPVIRNMLLLSQDISRAHQEQKTQAAYWGLRSWGAMMSGDPAIAKICIARASALAPNDENIRAIAASLAEGKDSYQYSNFADQTTRNAYMFVGHGLFSLANGDVDVAIKNLEAAQALGSKDPAIVNIARMVRDYAAKRTGANTKMEKTP